LIDEIDRVGGGTGIGDLVPGEIGLDALDDTNITADGSRIDAAPGIGYFQRNGIVTCLGLGV
jgi:hypothetical protein